MGGQGAAERGKRLRFFGGSAAPRYAIEAGFKGKGPWKKGLPRILETLETISRARREGAGWRG